MPVRPFSLVLTSLVLMSSGLWISSSAGTASADRTATYSIRADATERTTSVVAQQTASAFTPCGPSKAPTAHLKAMGLQEVTHFISQRRQAEPPTPSVTRSARDLPGIVKLEPEHDEAELSVSKGHCSASRIADNWLVTAAHCVAEDYDRIFLKVGSDTLSSPDIRKVPVDLAICHGDYTAHSSGYRNDVALLHVSDDELLTLDSVPVISWGQTTQPFTTSTFLTARVGGWGLINVEAGELADHLQKMELDVFDIKPGLIRLSSRPGRGPCIGDSGGPLIVEDAGRPVLMGVLSTLSANPQGRICEGAYNASYTNLEGYRSWIETSITACEQNSILCQRH